MDNPAGLPGRVERLLHDKEARGNEVHAPLDRLGLAIVGAANELRRTLTGTLGFKPGPPPSEPEVLTFYELLYFFAHLTRRVAVGRKFSEQQIGKLQAYLGPMLGFISVNIFFYHWPPDRKLGVRAEFLDKLRAAEVEYSSCRGLISPEDPLNGDTLVGKLVHNVSGLSARSLDESAKRKIATAALKKYDEMGLDQRLVEVLSVIDGVDTESIVAFWRTDAD